MVQLFYYTPKKAFLTLPLTHSENPGVGRTVIQIRTERLSVARDLPLELCFEIWRTSATSGNSWSQV